MITAQEIRKSMRVYRNNFATSADYIMHSSLCQENIMQSKTWQESEDIALYLPFRGEVQTDLLIDNAYSMNKKLYFPRCDKDIAGKMDFINITKNNFSTSFCSGAYGISEPQEKLEKSNLPEKTLVILPCLAYSKNGYRLGYGGGYYDRLLAINKKKNNYYTALLLAFSFQENNEISPQTWDIPVQLIANEKELICCNT